MNEQNLALDSPNDAKKKEMEYYEQITKNKRCFEPNKHDKTTDKPCFLH